RGALSVAVCAKEKGIANLIVPAENAAEAAVVEGVNVYGVRCLAEVVALVARPEEFSPVRANGNGHHSETVTAPDFRDVRGQAAAAAAPAPPPAPPDPDEPAAPPAPPAYPTPARGRRAPSPAPCTRPRRPPPSPSPAPTGPSASARRSGWPPPGIAPSAASRA